MKRPAGMQVGKDWLVLLESTKFTNDNWIHKCGSLVHGHTVRRINKVTKDIMKLDVPYCPVCEEVPK